MVGKELTLFMYVTVFHAASLYSFALTYSFTRSDIQLLCGLVFALILYIHAFIGYPVVPMWFMKSLSVYFNV